MSDHYCFNLWFSSESLADSIYISRLAPFKAERDDIGTILLGNFGEAVSKDTNRR